MVGAGRQGNTADLVDIDARELLNERDYYSSNMYSVLGTSYHTIFNNSRKTTGIPPRIAFLLSNTAFLLQGGEGEAAMTGSIETLIQLTHATARMVACPLEALNSYVYMYNIYSSGTTRSLAGALLT